MNELTREQILAMPAGRELDNLIVKYVLRKATSKDRPNWYLISGTTSSSVQEWVKIPRFSKDISAAWEVVKKLEGSHYFHCSRLHGQSYQSIQGNGYGVDFERTDGEGFSNAEAHTLPEAICKASLLAVRGL